MVEEWGGSGEGNHAERSGEGGEVGWRGGEEFDTGKSNVNEQSRRPEETECPTSPTARKVQAHLGELESHMDMIQVLT